MATSGGLLPDYDTYANWATSPGGPFYSILRSPGGGWYGYAWANGQTYECHMGLEGVAIDAGYKISAVSLSVGGWSNDGGIAVRCELWTGGTPLAYGDINGASWAASGPAQYLSAAQAADLRLRLVLLSGASGNSGTGPFARCGGGASGSWSASRVSTGSKIVL